jgi:radical SAM protein with 4Fe4S-binding SPASM domain
MEPQRGFTVQWHITDRCNLQCTHCYRDEKVKDLSLAHLKKIADNILRGIKTLQVFPCFALSGGEPFLREDLFELIEYLHQKGVTSILMETNGTLLTSEVTQSLIHHSPPVATIQVSLDGSTPSVHDSIRGKGSFEKALSGLKRIIKDTNLYTTISYTFHQQNMDDIPSIVQLGESLSIDTLYLTRLVPIGHGKEIDLLTPEQTRNVLSYLHEKNEEFKKSKEKKPVIAENRCLFHLTNPEEAVTRYKSGKGRLGNACAVGSSTFTILPDGTALPCRRLPIPLGNLQKESFLDIWFKNDLLWDFRRRQKTLKGKCRQCPFLEYTGLCDGGAACVSYGYYHDYTQPDPQCWYEPEGIQ